MAQNKIVDTEQIMFRIFNVLSLGVNEFKVHCYRDTRINLYLYTLIMD